jgi:AcrR family transcriptional regulator
MRFAASMVLFGTKATLFLMKTKPIRTAPNRLQKPGSENPKRTRVLQAAFSAFQELGYGGASTLEIATRAKVSKRELYTYFSNKQAMLAACIAERTKRMRLPLETPATMDRKAVATTLTAFGTAILRGVCDPSTLAAFRLAIAESVPEIAHALDAAGRQANHTALIAFLRKAQEHGHFRAADPGTMATSFFALLWGDLLVWLLLRVTDPPTAKGIDRRARAATDALLRLFPEPKRLTAKPLSRKETDNTWPNLY